MPDFSSIDLAGGKIPLGYFVNGYKIQGVVAPVRSESESANETTNPIQIGNFITTDEKLMVCRLIPFGAFVVSNQQSGKYAIVPDASLVGRAEANGNFTTGVNVGCPDNIEALKGTSASQYLVGCSLPKCQLDEYTDTFYANTELKRGELATLANNKLLYANIKVKTGLGSAKVLSDIMVVNCGGTGDGQNNSEFNIGVNAAVFCSSSYDGIVSVVLCGGKNAVEELGKGDYQNIITGAYNNGFIHGYDYTKFVTAPFEVCKHTSYSYIQQGNANENQCRVRVYVKESDKEQISFLLGHDVPSDLYVKGDTSSVWVESTQEQLYSYDESSLNGSLTDTAGFEENQVNTSKLKGLLPYYEKYILPECRKYNLNAAIVSAQIGWETGWGSSNVFHSYNNVGGLSFEGKPRSSFGDVIPAGSVPRRRSEGGYYYTFKTLADGFEAHAYLLKHNYFNNATTVKDVFDAYVRKGYATDPKYRNSILGTYESLSTKKH